MITLRNTDNQQIQSLYGWLESYSGSFDFLQSLKAQLLVKGYLSEKQIDAAERCRSRERPKLTLVTPVAAPKYSVKPGDVLEITRSFAKRLAEQNGSTRLFFNLEVLEVKAETHKAILIRTKASAKVMSHCCVCGRSLTDPASILSGIGPVCASNNGIPHGDAEITKSALAEMATKEVEITTWVPKSTIKNLDALMSAGHMSG